MDRGDVTAKRPIALTIAGSDSGGGAGAQADLRTFAAMGVYGASAITALTAQNTLGVRLVHVPPPGVLLAQIEAVLEDFNVVAIKIGMLANAANVSAVARALIGDALHRARAPFVALDPVLRASSGDALGDDGLAAAIADTLLVRVDCLTPNLAEAAALLDCEIAADEAEMRRQGEALLERGPRAVLMKGGHLPGDEAVDWLVTHAGARRYAAPRLASRAGHGTGCTLSSAIAAGIASGRDLSDAVGAAKALVSASIARGGAHRLGEGEGPLLQLALGAH